MRPVKALLWDAMGRVPDHVVNDCVEASGRLREVVGYFNGPMARIRALVGWTPQCRDCLKVCEGRACSKADPLHIALLLTYIFSFWRLRLRKG